MWYETPLRSHKDTPEESQVPRLVRVCGPAVVKQGQPDLLHGDHSGNGASAITIVTCYGRLSSLEQLVYHILLLSVAVRYFQNARRSTVSRFIPRTHCNHSLKYLCRNCVGGKQITPQLEKSHSYSPKILQLPNFRYSCAVPVLHLS